LKKLPRTVETRTSICNLFVPRKINAPVYELPDTLHNTLFYCRLRRGTICNNSEPIIGKAVVAESEVRHLFGAETSTYGLTKSSNEWILPISASSTIGVPVRYQLRECNIGKTVTGGEKLTVMNLAKSHLYYCNYPHNLLSW